MDIVLDDIEARILGCLIEKEMTTPEYYPLSLNTLMNACNQKSNRKPIFSLDESVVQRGLDSLRQKGLSWETHVPGSRVTKFEHDLLSQFDLSKPGMAVLCELLLRGPQTPGELRSNTERMAPVGRVGEMEETLRDLMDHNPPLVVRLMRETGKREARYAHLFSPEIAQGKALSEHLATSAESGLSATQSILKLEDEIAQIRRELEELKQAFTEFKSQF